MSAFTLRTLFIALLFVGIPGLPAIAHAGVSDTSDGCAVGSQPGAVFVPGSEVPATGCIPIGSGAVVSAADAGNIKQPAPTTKDNCSLLSPGSWFSDCVWKPLMSWLGSWFLSLGGFALSLSGTLFDSLIYHVVVDFKSTLDYLSITTAIDAGWTVFRDFTNILIIGLFVFIAIGIILGLQEFGQKRLIANVLIVAVLINFSLLFTKLIIDASNFTAFTIYRQIAATPLGSTSGAGQTTYDIAGAYLKPMGITSIWNDTYIVSKRVADQNNSAMAGFVFGLVGGLLLIAVAAVLFYGCFLILSRGILFIFLMLTAALAFATYLIPSLSKGEYGWSSWWRTLINNAVFAPLLMLFLAVSLAIVKQAANLKGGSAEATLGDVIANPQSQLTGNGWAMILIYLIGIGLLFVSLKMSSKFAGSISGFNFASMVPALGVLAGARAAGALSGMLGRNTIGRGAAWASDRMEKASKDTGRSNLSRQLYDFGAQRFKGVAKSDLNAMRTGLAGAMAGAAGLKADQIAGKQIGGFLGAQEKIAGAIADKAARMTAKPADQEKRNAEIVAKEIAKSAALSAEHADASQYREAWQENVKNSQEGLAKMAEKHDAEMRELQSTLSETRRMAAEGTRTREDVEAVEHKISVRKAEQLEEMNKQTQRIKEAKESVTAAAGRVAAVEKQGRAVAESKGLVRDIQTAEQLAGNMAENRFMSRFYGSEENHRLAHMAEHHVEAEGKKKKIKDLGLGKLIADAADKAAPAPAPAAPAHAPAAPAAHPPAGGGGGDAHGGGDHGGGHH